MLRRSVICLAVLCLYVVYCNSQGFEIPIHKHKSARQLMMELDTGEEHLQSLSAYRLDTNPPLPNDTVSLFRFLDAEYYGIIGIGHPAQQFKVRFDTTWANVYVPSKLCGLAVPACWLLNKYDERRSGTYHRNGTAFFVNQTDGVLSGFFSTDDINLGHIKVKQQTFAEITNFPLMNIFSEVDGVIGMGFDSLAVGNAETLFSNIFKQQLLEQPIFAFYLNRDSTTPHAGSLMLGSGDPKHYKPETLVTVPVTSDFYWQFKVTKMVIDSGNDNMTFCANGCQAAIDTGTRSIIGPADEVMEINNYLQATKLVLNRYEVPCNQISKLPKFNITIGNQTFTMHGKDMVEQMSVRGFQVCLSVFIPSKLPSSESSIWFLGSAFLQRAYVIFDMGKHTLGFAQVK